MNTKKCIVVDLDNTLWGGVVGEDGLKGIALSLSGPGSGFIAFQQALLDLHDRGVILAVNSRNNFNDAMEVIRKHPNSILKEHHFAAFRINWNDKTSNMMELASEIGIGLDSIVFLDDDPVNRTLMRVSLPDVETPDLPLDSADYAKFLMSLPYFPKTAMTDEDKMRGNLYVTERLRKEAEKSFPDRSAFLRSLSLELQIFANDQSSVARLSQLSEKTNQFNVSKRPLTPEAIKTFINSSEHIVFHGRSLDRFGDHGITNFAVAERRKNGLWVLTSFLMSCRVIGRGIEDAFLSAIADVLRTKAATHLSIEFVPTEKNKPAEIFVRNRFPQEYISLESVESPEWILITYGDF